MATVKVRVYSAPYGDWTFCDAKKPGHPGKPTSGLEYLGIVEVERVGVVWGDTSEVNREITDRVFKAAVEAGLLTPENCLQLNPNLND